MSGQRRARRARGDVRWSVINPAGQLIEMHHDCGRWVVTTWTPMLPGEPVAVSNFRLEENAEAHVGELAFRRPDHLGGTPAEHWRLIQAMRKHPTWDAAGEDQP